MSAGTSKALRRVRASTPCCCWNPQHIPRSLHDHALPQLWERAQRSELCGQ
jgi:hypothetical protein